MTDHAITNDSDISIAQFRALANSIPNLAWMAHPDGWIFWYNKRWYEYTGSTPEAMAGWGWQAVHHPDHLPEILEQWTHALSHGEFFQMTFPLKGADGVFRPFLTRVEPLREKGAVVGWFGTNTEVTEQEKTRERLELLINELNHRVKNTLATIQSLAMQTLRVPSADASETFQKRLLALATVHDILTKEMWGNAPVREVVATALNFCGVERFRVSGPDVSVTPPVASALAMTLHELCTNAVKYGALSVPNGHVNISWTVETTGASARMEFLWKELGGPPVRLPARKGFGSKLIERALASEVSSGVSLNFATDGLECRINVAVSIDSAK